MANLTQTAANVGIGSLNVRPRGVYGGEAITQGMPVRIDNTTSPPKYYKADANTSATTAEASGIAITPCSGDGGSFLIFEGEGLVNLGATLSVNEVYVVSSTAGAICPASDLTTGDYLCILGVATTSSLLKTIFAFSGVAKT